MVVAATPRMLPARPPSRARRMASTRNCPAMWRRVAPRARCGAAFQDGDDYDVGDADAADEQSDGSQVEEQGVVGTFGEHFGQQDSSVTVTVEGLAGLTVACRTAATALTWDGLVRTYSSVEWPSMATYSRRRGSR